MVPCKSCGLLHSSMIRCEVAKRMLEHVAEQKAEAGQVKKAGGSFQVAPGESLPKDSKPSPESVSAPFDRKTYQREYMRKYRAKIALNRLKP